MDQVSTDVSSPWYLTNAAIDGRRPGGIHWAALIDAARRAQVALASSNPPDSVVLAAADAYHELARLLEPHITDERMQAFGRRPDLLGVGQSHRPAITMTEMTNHSVTGTVTFDRTYLGARRAVHGGIVSLLFDDLFGVVAHVGARPAARTAYLHLDYRTITPIDTELVVAAWIAEEKGRKRIVAGELRHQDRVCAEAQALFVQLHDPAH